jgi:hypothetical protein
MQKRSRYTQEQSGFGIASELLALVSYQSNKA